MKSFGKTKSYLNKFLVNSNELATNLWQTTKVESQETKLAIIILSKMMKGEKVSQKEKKFLKAQSKDIVKILPLVILPTIPIPLPLTPFWILIGKKYDLDIFPKDHRDILSDDKDS